MKAIQNETHLIMWYSARIVFQNPTPRLVVQLVQVFGGVNTKWVYQPLRCRMAEYKRSSTSTQRQKDWVWRVYVSSFNLRKTEIKPDKILKLIHHDVRTKKSRLGACLSTTKCTAAKTLLNVFLLQITNQTDGILSKISVLDWFCTYSQIWAWQFL